MKTYTFYPIPSEHHHSINITNCIVYLNNSFLCTSAYSIIISYTILGKQLYIYNLNGQKIFTATFPESLKEISYMRYSNSIYLEFPTQSAFQ